MFHHVLYHPGHQSPVLCVCVFLCLCVSCVAAWALCTLGSLSISVFSYMSVFRSFSLSLSVGDVLFQMAEVHRQIQVQLEEMVGIHMT